jgi:hypothetical protein
MAELSLGRYRTRNWAVLMEAQGNAYLIGFVPYAAVRNISLRSAVSIWSSVGRREGGGRK